MLRGVKRKRGGSDEVVEPTQYDEMSPVFRLVSLYEVALHDEWKYVKLYCPLDRTALKNGIMLGVGLEAFRGVLAVAILVLLVIHRLKWMNPLDGSNSSIPFSVGSTLLLYWIAITLILIVLIIFQIACYYTQTPGKIVISTCLNFIFSILLICLLFILALFLRNSENIISDAFAKNFQSFSEFENFQRENKCCGFMATNDWRNAQYFHYTDPMTFEKLTVTNKLEWTRKYDDFILNFPDSCCVRIVRTLDKSCAFQNSTDIWKMREMYKNEDIPTLLSLLETPSENAIHPYGCLALFLLKAENYANFLVLLLIVFAILTALMILFVIVLLLYEDGIGQVVSKTMLFDVSRNTGVNWLINLDNKTDKPFIDEFSLIEYLRETDIDNIVVEPPTIERKMRIL